MDDADTEYARVLRALEVDPDNVDLLQKRIALERRRFGMQDRDCQVNTTIYTLWGDYEATFSPPPGLSVLYGKNGVGKTQLMKATAQQCGGRYYDFLDLRHQNWKDTHSYLLSDGSNLGLILGQYRGDTQWKDIISELLNLSNFDQRILDGPPEHWFQLGSGTLNVMAYLAAFISANKYSIILLERMNAGIHYSVLDDFIDIIKDICEKKKLRAVVSTTDAEFVTYFQAEETFVLVSPNHASFNTLKNYGCPVRMSEYIPRPETDERWWGVMDEYYSNLFAAIRNLSA